MGKPDSSPLVVVADAGPLIHLNEIGQLQLLSIFGSVFIPDAVWIESVINGTVRKEDIEQLVSCRRHTLNVTDVVQFVAQNRLEHLQSGECECLCLCVRSAVPLLLTDDLAVRDAAKRLDLMPVGSLGLVVRAYRIGLLTLAAAEHCLRDLQSVSSLYVVPAIVELAIEQLHLPTNPEN
jgi:predicted nucleic acid-binding protein